MSSETNAANPNSSFSETAKVRIVSRRQLRQTDYKLANVLVSSRIYWKAANEDGTNKPESFLDFRNDNSVILSRLDDDKTWEDVCEFVKEGKHNGQSRITICAHLRGRARRNNPFLVGNVQVEIIANTQEQHKVWLNQIRAQVAPWKVLQDGLKAMANDKLGNEAEVGANEAANDEPSLDEEELEKTLRGLVTTRDDIEPSSMPRDETNNKMLDFLGKLPEKMEKLFMMEKLNTHGAGAVGSGSKFETLVGTVENVAERAKLIGETMKCIAVVSSIFQLLVLGAQGVSMFARAVHGRKVLPKTLCRMWILLKYVLESMITIRRHSQEMDNINLDFVFDALRQTLCTMDLAETQLWRRGVSQVIYADDVKEVEKKLGDVEHRVVTAGVIAKICTMVEIVSQLKEEQNLWDNEPHHERPPLSAFFCGRSEELDKLRDILEKRGSAVITQYGGVGKTELMIALAYRAERDEQEPREVFWVTVDGGKSNVTESLAELVDKLTRRKMSEEARRNENLVIVALKQVLDKRKGRWLLCLDNADDIEVRDILNEVCGIVRGRQSKGWVVVTSRQGQPHLWNRMKSEQKLVLKPLRAEDAMVALWRQTRKIESCDMDDDKVMEEIKELEGVNEAEYRALKKLCGDDDGHGLGGLPLALVQAGSFIAQFEYSFAKYLDLFESANRNEEWEYVMNKANGLTPIRESQRSIWTTWKISVEKLSVIARTVLQGMAMLGQGGIGESMVKGIVEAAATDGGSRVNLIFDNVIMKELMHGSSLIWRDEEEERGRRTYGMHRLVRRFVLNDMWRDSTEWNHVYSLALPIVCESIRAELEKECKSFYDLPDLFNTNHRELSMHSMALVHHFVMEAQGSEGCDVSGVEKIHRYSGKVMWFMGKFKEASVVWKQLLAILEQQSEKIGQTVHGNKLHSGIALSLGNLGNVYEKMGKLNKALEKLEESLEMYRAVHGNKPHPDTALSLRSLGNVYLRMSKLDKALEKYEESLEMYRAVHGNKPHPDIASCHNNLGLVYEGMGELDEALEKQEESLKMYRAVHGNKPHPQIASSLNNLVLVYAGMGKLDKAMEKHEESLEMKRAIYGNKPHPDIASSLNNLGLVYFEMGELEKALEKHEECLNMRREVYRDMPHFEIASCLNNLGNVYVRMGELEKALEKHDESLEMRRAVHGNKPHSDIASSLNNLGDVYERMGKLDKAMEKYEESLEMYRAVHGNKPHPDIAKLLWNIGINHRWNRNISRAVEILEQSLEMLLTVHGRNLQHTNITAVRSTLADVYGEQGRQDEVADIANEIER